MKWIHDYRLLYEVTKSTEAHILILPLSYLLGSSTDPALGISKIFESVIRFEFIDTHVSTTV